MANQVTINSSTNSVSVNQSDKIVTIAQPSTTTVEVFAGPQGAKGDQGEPFNTTEKRINIDTAGDSGSIVIGNPPLYDDYGVLAFGRNALANYTGGEFNNSVAVGDFSLETLVSGSPNDAFGVASLRFLGEDPDTTSAYTPDYNTGFGAYAGHRWQGYVGTWIGQFCGPYYNNAYGRFNVGIGALTMINLSGSKSDRSNSNTGIGAQCLYNLKIGTGNTAVGYNSLYNLQLGRSNTGVGPQSLNNLTGGQYNTAIGIDAGRFLTTGSRNIFIGSQASGFTSGSNNVIVGSFDNLGVGNIDGNIIFTDDSAIRYRFNGTDTTIYSPLNTSGSLTVTGSATITDVLTLEPQNPLPSGVATGSFAVSSSVPPKPYFFDGTNWNALY